MLIRNSFARGFCQQVISTQTTSQINRNHYDPTAIDKLSTLYADRAGEREEHFSSV